MVLDGEKAVESLEEEIPDVMVLDLKMPGMNGIEVLKKVKEAYPQVKVVMLTGHGSENDEEEVERKEQQVSEGVGIVRSVRARSARI